ncbi:hypothetical protein J2Y67_002071 [Neobacillus niacini]|nr:hypothetical protein [Neobacillus niacini]
MKIQTSSVGIRTERVKKMNHFVLYFNEINQSSLPLVGGKGANLGK